MMFTTIKSLAFFAIATFTQSTQSGVDARVGGAAVGTSGDSFTYTIYVANICKQNDVTIKMGGSSKKFSPNTCESFERNQYPNHMISFTEIGDGAWNTQMDCGEPGSTMMKCNLPEIANDACVITTSMCGTQEMNIETKAPTEVHD
mmetsp:Transcript_46155/g.51620  ORF Transcript_46155/g.51620 Transcript_46155/m.51620 type:complete len:146 (-) Transcript_46155:71-508(-)|eukprot:CAMPEP_0170853792 /NCGR_PEP_ID=MMETSP0734-20130129/12757_1 /TAXON_ID=186038 /ORGANISM="Fragilariopsis kerguelensis, Strain L26-C5" /LENGTH=145 /DNA_ID=CAMNT_0011224605 /DNA_START=75 /DNA_END=512 /DNA_ORIENTATION=-